MKTMNILSILTIIIGFSQCASAKFEENPPFTITSVVYENWSGGQPGIRGTNVKIFYLTNKEVVFDSVYYQGKVTHLQIKTAKNNQLVVGYFNTSSVKNQIILNENPVEEINNPVPNLNNFPFKLNKNEAVISYKFKGKLKYYKVKGLKEEKSARIPSAPNDK